MIRRQELAAVGIVLAAVCIAVAQQATDDPPTAFATTVQPINFFGNEPEPAIEEKMGILGVDPATWKIVGVDPDGIGINSPEQRLDRHLVAMQFLDPEAYAALFPPTEEQLAAIDQALFQFLHNDEYTAQLDAQKTPQQLLAEQLGREAMLDLLNHGSPGPQGPPPEAFPQPPGMPNYESSPTSDTSGTAP